MCVCVCADGLGELDTRERRSRFGSSDRMDARTHDLERDNPLGREEKINVTHVKYIDRSDSPIFRIFTSTSHTTAIGVGALSLLLWGP